MEVNPFELLKEELDSDEAHIRINAVHRLKLAATCMTSDGIKNQLLPFIDSKSNLI